MKFCIVVARYNENIEWLKQINTDNDNVNIIIFNKGEPLKNENDNVIEMANVGREGHTYYKYIYDNYDNLYDYTIFLQGHPFDHSPNVINNIHKYINDTKLNVDFEYLSEVIIHCNLSGCNHHYGLPLIETYEKLFNERKEEMAFTFGCGAQFIVSKKNIVKRPKEFYYKIVEMLQHHSGPAEGFVIERFQKLIFS
jgi:hypothetical protein